MKRLIQIFLFLSFFVIGGFAQDSSAYADYLQNETPSAPKPVIKKKKVVAKKDSALLVNKPLQPVVDTNATTKRYSDTIIPIDTSNLATKAVDSLPIQDSLRQANASKTLVDEIDTSTYGSLAYINHLPFNGSPIFRLLSEKQHPETTILFYAIVGTVFLLALVKIIFPRYLALLFTQFFKTTWRRMSFREQVLQQPLPSLITNFIFLLTGSIYAALMVQQQQWINEPFGILLLYCGGLLLGIYAGKFLFLVFAGWVFNVKAEANQYIFVVYLNNKMLGIVLLPFIAIVAFSGGVLAEVFVTISVFIILASLCYRYFISLNVIGEPLKVNALHFFLYLCTIEVLPLLLIYKAFFNYIR